MKELEEQGSLIERFQSAKPDYRLYAEAQTTKTIKDNDNIQFGQKSGSVESTQLTSAAASKKLQGAAQEKADKEAKQLADDLLFLQLLQQIEEIDEQLDFLNKQTKLLSETISALQNGTIDIGQALQQEHVQRAIRAWEARHPGQTFNPSADDADQQLMAIMDEQRRTDGDTMSALQDRRADLVQKAGEINHLYRTDPELAKQQAEERAANSYNDADILGNKLETDELADASSSTQDEHRDAAINTTQAEIDNDDGFGSALEMASSDLNEQFPTAAADKPATPAQVASVEVKLDLTNSV